MWGKEDMVAAGEGEDINALYLQITNAIRHRMVDVVADAAMQELSHRHQEVQVPLPHPPHKIEHSSPTS